MARDIRIGEKAQRPGCTWQVVGSIITELARGGQTADLDLFLAATLFIALFLHSAWLA
jgi:hypothetical protein